MKKLYFTILASICLQISLYSQNKISNNEVEGLYLTLLDFEQAKITKPIDNKHKNDKIYLNQFLQSAEIKTVEDTNVNVFFKDSIFAIHMKNGSNYRFVNKTPCLIVDTSYLYIYSNKTTKTEYKQYGQKRKATEVPVTYFYFSYGSHNTVYALTLENIYKLAVFEPKLYSIIAAKFKTNEMLSHINPITGKFEINECIIDNLK